MICAKCGGEILLNESCDNCGIGYEEMINCIDHSEMKRLFKRIEKNHENTEIDESLMACELLNSTLILPIRESPEGRAVLQIPGPGGKRYIGIFTDIDEFKRGNVEMTLFTSSWSMLMDLLGGDVEGFVINVFGEGVFLGGDFLDEYFGDD